MSARDAPPRRLIVLLGRRRCGVATGKALRHSFDREFLERRQVVRRHPDDLRAGFLEIGDAVAESVGFGGAAAGECLGEEIEDDRALLQLLGEVELEWLAADRAGGGEIRSLGADRERGQAGVEAKAARPRAIRTLRMGRVLPCRPSEAADGPPAGHPDDESMLRREPAGQQ